MPPEVADSEGIRAVYTVQGYCYRFCRDGTFDRINHVLVMQRRKWPDERRLPPQDSPHSYIVPNVSAKTVCC